MLLSQRDVVGGLRRLRSRTEWADFNHCPLSDQTIWWVDRMLVAQAVTGNAYRPKYTYVDLGDLDTYDNIFFPRRTYIH